MSDEPPPSPLRLRPRQRSESEEAASPAAPDEGKLRLKPKLGDTFDDAKPAEPEEPAEAEAPPAEPVRAKPKLNLEPDPEPEPQPEPEPAAVEPAVEEPPVVQAEEAPPPPPLMPEEGKIKLKIKLPGAVAQDATIPPTEEPVEAEPSLPPFPVVAPPPEEGEEGNIPPLLNAPPTPAARTLAPFPGTLPPGGSRPAVFKRPRVPAALLAAERRKRMWKYAGVAVVAVMLAGGVIFGAYLKLSEPPPPTRLPPRPVNPVKTPEPAVVAPVPSKTPTPTVETPIEPNSTTRVNSAVSVELAPGVSAMTEAVKAVPNASSAFKQFVASAKISGVYQGTPPRAFINGRLVHTGEMVDDALEIYFDSVDLPARSIVFKDGRGATVSRRY